MESEKPYVPTKRELLMKVIGGITRVAFWAFLLSIYYGVGTFSWKYIDDPSIPLYLRVGIGSLAVLISGLFVLFMIDPTGDY